MAESVCAQIACLREQTDLSRRYCEIAQKYSAVLAKDIELLNENTRLKLIMSAAPALTAAAEKSIEHVQEVEAAWTQSGNECVQ